MNLGFGARSVACAFFVLSVLGFVGERRAFAHQRSVSHATLWIAGKSVEVELRTSESDVELALRAANIRVTDASAVRRYFLSRLRVSADGRDCAVASGSFRELTAEPGYAAWEWTAECAKNIERAIVQGHLFEEVLPHHLGFVRIANGGVSTDDVLTDGHRTAEFDASRGDVNVRFLSFLRLGVEHILTGYDHLVFLLALLMGAASLGGLVRVVTGFTIGHSLTLAFAVFGWVHPTTALVESAIGISIVVVAVENVSASSGRAGWPLPSALVGALVLGALLNAVSAPDVGWTLGGFALAAACLFGLLRRSAYPERLRGAVSASFGLLHGLGFAGALAEHPIPRSRLLPALAGFNVGVEVGQLAAIAVAWALLSTLKSRSEYARDWVYSFGNAAACGAGVFWAVTRLP